MASECPKCGSSDVVSNKIVHKGQGAHAAHIGGHAAMHGHPVGAAIVGGVYLAGKVIDQFTDDYRCKRCDHTF